jgi:hypothetical protein
VTGRTVADEVLDVARRVALEAPDPLARRQAAEVAERLSGPLRVAIAGRVKAGKSTLLNALVGERLAPTDAGECTRLVTRYRRGPGYEVVAQRHDGSREPLAFQRAAGRLDVRLGGVVERDVAFVDVAWPTSALESITLIDTPGLASIDDGNSRRTRDFLEFDPDRPGDADAVIYLLRHAHRADVQFLDAFMDRSVTAASPVNAVAVLSRADEIGAGRLDAMESATRIAARCRQTPELAGLCAAVVPMAGLLAETGLTLREDEAAALRELVATDPSTLERMLLSADHFCEVGASVLTVELRRDLLARLGMYGLRCCVEDVRTGLTPTAAAIGPRLVERSGLPELRSLLTSHFGPRAKVLQARTALVSLRAVARSLRTSAPSLAAEVERRLEQIESGTVAFSVVRAAHLVATGAVALPDEAQGDLDRLLVGGDAAALLGRPAATPADELRAGLLGAIGRWRALASDPLADPATTEVAAVAARAFEHAYSTT